jgi:guanosine-3',5'-bis(diphosphate) 3'-pyrophosphohydrolase
MISKEILLEKIKKMGSKYDLEEIAQACDFSMSAHGAQKRESGDPYYLHPLEVSNILVEMKLDQSSIITGLLHDTIEDTDITLEIVEQKFGSEVSRLVDGVTKLTRIEYQPDHVRQAENFRKLLLAMSEDIRVLLVKLADRLHNMRTLHYVKSAAKRIRVAHETMEIYAPLAERIGMQALKTELQDLAFQQLYPEARKSIINRLNYLKRDGNIIVDKIVEQISLTLKKAGLEAAVFGREKTPCSIWQKMERKNVGFEQLSDIIGFRIIVRTIPECYQALGIIHSNYHLIPDNFKDFISTPKSNGYRSLHTVVMGPERQRIEIQIRTQEMQEIAEYGVAAHWSYKQSFQYNVESKEYKWLKELLEILEGTSDSEEFLENTKMEMYYDQVFCFSPKGHLIALPKGATAVDFAYGIHSDVGNSCVGAKINGRIVPLRTQLQNGDQVEIIRSKIFAPSPTWEKFVITGKARAEIRKFIRLQKRQEYINLGRAILSKVFKEYNFEYKDEELARGLKTLNKATIEDILFAAGEGTISREQIMKVLFPDAKPINLSSGRFSFLRFNRKKVEDEKEHTVQIKGLIPGMALHFGTCCYPLPGDRIVGIVNIGKGITIHTTDCELLESFSSSPEKWIGVSWNKDQTSQNYTGQIKIMISHEKGSLLAVVESIFLEHGNITNLKIISRSTDFFEMLIDIEIRGLEHLSSIIASLRAKSCVHSVTRYKN